MFEIHRIFKMKSNTTSKIGIMGEREKIVRKTKNEKKNLKQKSLELV